MDNMDSLLKKAMSGREKGYTCSQCVVCAFSDLLEVNEIDLFKCAEGFGGGIGGMMETCGVVSAMTMITGLITSSGNIANNTSKEKTINLTRELVNEFKAINHTISCREIRGIDSGIPLKECDECIKDGIVILAKKLFKDQIKSNSL